MALVDLLFCKQKATELLDWAKASSKTNEERDELSQPGKQVLNDFLGRVGVAAGLEET